MAKETIKPQHIKSRRRLPKEKSTNDFLKDISSTLKNIQNIQLSYERETDKTLNKSSCVVVFKNINHEHKFDYCEHGHDHYELTEYRLPFSMLPVVGSNIVMRFYKPIWECVYRVPEDMPHIKPLDNSSKYYRVEKMVLNLFSEHECFEDDEDGSGFNTFEYYCYVKLLDIPIIREVIFEKNNNNKHK
jgi:urate oxidase